MKLRKSLKGLMLAASTLLVTTGCGQMTGGSATAANSLQQDSGLRNQYTTVLAQETCTQLSTATNTPAPQNCVPDLKAKSNAQALMGELPFASATEDEFMVYAVGDWRQTNPASPVTTSNVKPVEDSIYRVVKSRFPQLANSANNGYSNNGNTGNGYPQLTNY